MWNWRRLNITSSTIFVGRRADSDFASLVPPLTSNPGYAQWDVAWSYRSTYRVTYFGATENILNRAYMDVLGFPALKFTARAGIRVEF
jgi:outer membrane cobalamin receptor